jgi:hypothetical protein
MKNTICSFDKKENKARCWWLRPVIIASWKAKIWRTVVQG